MKRYKADYMHSRRMWINQQEDFPGNKAYRRLEQSTRKMCGLSL